MIQAELRAESGQRVADEQEGGHPEAEAARGDHVGDQPDQPGDEKRPPPGRHQQPDDGEQAQ